MKLLDIIGNYPILQLTGPSDMDIRGIEHNSKKITKGDLFIAQKGFTHDGHKYIGEALDRGAIAIVLQQDTDLNGDVTVIKLLNSRDALGYFSGRFYGLPWKRMKMIGITGTNGKTSTSYYLKSIFNENKSKSAILGTIGVIMNKSYTNVINTTPDSLAIHKMLSQMVENNIEYCCMEISSHALALKRVKYIDFDLGIFTNLSEEHLDYHKTMEEYFKVKQRLFSKTKTYNIVNIDDSYGKILSNKLENKIPILNYSLRKKAHAYATGMEYYKNKIKFTFNLGNNREDIILDSPGEFNIYNALAAGLCASTYGINLPTIKAGIEKMKTIKGRFEFLPLKTDFNVIIDFAHTADGLKEALKAIGRFTLGRVIVVFGAGGDRDKSKRAHMGQVAGTYADYAIITTDNPRYEKPEMIIDDIMVGINKTNVNYIKILDRKEAIEHAIKIAKSKDTILLAGKGHEEYIILGDKKYPFSERQLVSEIVNNIVG